MSQFRFKERLFWDIITNIILVFLLVDFFRRVLDLEFSLSPEKIVLILSVAVSISIIHSLLCLNSSFFWKFAFLLPDEIYYYILAKKKRKSSDDLIINLGTYSNLILSKTEPNLILSKHELCPTDTATSKDILNKNLVMGNYQIIIKILKSTITSLQLTYKLNDDTNVDVILWLQLQKKNEKILDFENEINFYISKGQYGNKYSSWGDFIYLLFSKNVILLLSRSLVLTFIFLSILWQNPPLMMVIDPQQIQENWTQDEIHDIDIYAKNIGCNLINVDLETESFDEKLIGSNWIGSKKLFLSNDVGFIRLRIDNKIVPGEYRGSIKIMAKADRIIIPNDSNLQLPYLPIIKIPITSRTYTKKLAEVPFLIKITPGSNATDGRANGKLKHENLHPSYL